MTDHFKDIYENKADQYDLMVSREDYQGNLLKALQEIMPLAGLDVVEFGAGTGRVTGLLAPHVKSIRAYDAYQPMLDIASDNLKKLNLDNWSVAMGDNGDIPAEDASADITIEGWSFGHAVGWFPETWRSVIDQYVGEMTRITKPDGTIILIETQGTGNEQPKAPNEMLGQYFDYLETHHGFNFKWIRTDYQFESVEEANKLTRFFFGDALADRIVNEQLTTLPECTGIWWKSC